ncbi:two-component system sensor histidine kinase YesM [Paenibacillus sp. V4I9]|uniref:sensor histidine kinase n=1 Tax=Paenibacillus sp. V4I9 TaxID=3042308 RepID=UPI0027867E04|nr:histidine kinase [Paenibacillus sp. V4I9]MDQ0891114.1 two-component system sensor histidine kinase YesM [Paenibacillus sp. V4I9]
MQIHTLPLFKTLRFKLIFGLLIIVIPIVVFMIYNNLYAIQVVRNQVAQSNKNLISLYMGQIDRNLDEVDKYLFNFAAQDTGLLVLDAQRDQNADRYSFTKIQLNNKLLKDLPNYKSMDMFFVYSEPNQDLLTVMSDQVTYTRQEAVENSIKTIFQDQRDGSNQTSLKEWFMLKLGDQYFLTRVIKYGNVYIGAWTDASKLMVPLNLVDLGNNGRALLVTDLFETMSNQAFVQENQINLNDVGTDYKLTGKNEKFLVVGEKSAKGRFSLIAAIPDSKILENLPFLRRMVSFILMGSLILFPFILFLLRKIILVPINRIMMAMRRIEDGNLDVRITYSPSVIEFDKMNQSFNRMISQIQELKINVLEEQLNHQKAELKHLQLQINPHFFLNSLNIIYNLAQVKDFVLIQEMALCLVQYFRFMFRSNMAFVALRDEVQHTLNYFRIQEMRFPQNLTYDLSVPDNLMDELVPPLVIQTFVENTIKHAVSMDKLVHIGITIEAIEVNKIRIRVQDTGKGFPEDVLARLQMEMDIGNGEGHHIGIWNVQRRLRLLYQDQAQITFSNGAGHGAVIEILIPFHEKKGGESDASIAGRGR